VGSDSFAGSLTEAIPSKGMPKRSRKPRDLSAMAVSIVDQATDESPPPESDSHKNPAAVELGRLGGLKGGKARAANLSPEQRSEIARRAARARWSGNRKV
jgi:hypothetical protein